MRAAVAFGPHARLQIEDVVVKSLAPHDVIVNVEAAGRCHSDLNPLQGKSVSPGWPLVLGHEGTGTVLDVGSQVSSVRVGDRVIGSFVPSCGRCHCCVNGQTELCRDFYDAPRSRMTMSDSHDVFAWSGLGAFAEQMIASERSLVKVETSLPAEEVALISCGVTTGVCAVLNTARVTAGSSVAVLGVGGVGQSVVQGARIAGASIIIAVDPAAMKREMALRLGATHSIDPTGTPSIEAIRDLTDGRGVDFAFEVAGRSDTAAAGFDMICRGGTLVLVGVTDGAAMPQWGLKAWMLSEKRVVGSLYGSAQVHRDFRKLLRFAEQGQLNLSDMISNRVSLDDVNIGLDAIERGQVLRTVIVAPAA